MKNEMDTSCRARVMALIRDRMRSTPLDAHADQYLESVGVGKMLRAQLAYELGVQTGTPVSRLLAVGAAVEMIHAGSLLHDDVIDGGSLRRGVPSFWARHGVQGAILFGDTLLVEAMRLIREQEDEALLGSLIDLVAEVCMAEVEQELILRGDAGNWEQCINLARRKTGALFAFSAQGAGADEAQKAALTELGYLAGTAYQLADDILDMTGDLELAGKTLGRDQERGKTTATTVHWPGGTNPIGWVENLCAEAGEQVRAWPGLRKAWDAYLQSTLWPVIDAHLAPMRSGKMASVPEDCVDS